MTNQFYIMELADEFAEQPTVVLIRGEEELFRVLKLVGSNKKYVLLGLHNMGLVTDAQDLIADLIDNQKPKDMDFS
jgi:hypothetical protein